MEYFDYEINSEVSARVCYSKFGKMIYLVENSTGKELAKVSLSNGVDFFHFCDKISNEGINDEPETGGDLCQ